MGTNRGTNSMAAFDAFGFVGMVAGLLALIGIVFAGFSLAVTLRVGVSRSRRRRAPLGTWTAGGPTPWTVLFSTAPQH